MLQRQKRTEEKLLHLALYFPSNIKFTCYAVEYPDTVWHLEYLRKSRAE